MRVKCLSYAIDSGAGLLFAWGVTFLLVSTLIGAFKTEKDDALEGNYVQLNVVQNYKLLWDILKLPSIRVLLIALLTMRVNNVIIIITETFGTTDPGVY